MLKPIYENRKLTWNVLCIPIIIAVSEAVVVGRAFPVHLGRDIAERNKIGRGDGEIGNKVEVLWISK